MRIQTKAKDYWDHLTSVYGVDNKIVYNRKTEFKILPEKPMCILHICDKEYVGVLVDKKFVWDINSLLTHYDKLKSIHYRKISRVDDGVLYELGKYLFGDLSSWQISSDPIKRKKQAIKSPGIFSNINVKENSPIVVEQGIHFTNDPILLESNISSIISPQSMYLMITEWLSYKEPEIKRDPTDMNRFVSKGFDKKSSFRKV